jgi:hypothetical protein
MFKMMDKPKNPTKQIFTKMWEGLSYQNLIPYFEEWSKWDYVEVSYEHTYYDHISINFDASREETDEEFNIRMIEYEKDLAVYDQWNKLKL